MEYICDLQVYVVNCHIQYMTVCARMGKYVYIPYSNVDVYLESHNNLVSVSGQNDCASCFEIDLGFVNRVSGSNWQIMSDLVDSLGCICMNHRIVGIDILHVS